MDENEGNRFAEECFLLLSGTACDTEFIRQFCQKNHVTWVESRILSKGFQFVNGSEIAIEGLDGDHEYMRPGLFDRICYS